jgi:hypothetical protein
MKGWIPACAGMTGYGKGTSTVLLLSAVHPKPNAIALALTKEMRGQPWFPG